MSEIKIAFVVGHQIRNKGKWSKHLNVYEYDFFYMVSSLLTDVDVFTYEGIGYGAGDIKRLAFDLNKRRYDLVIEGHFNMSKDKRANGCETLYYFPNKESKRYAEWFSEKICSSLGLKKRGVSGARAVINGEDRGFTSVCEYTIPMILTEPFFGSNESDCNKVNSPEVLAGAIQEFINEVRESK